MLSFARTKIQPPRPRAGALLARPALDARLADAMRSQRLVLVCAAAGFGKTSVLAAQAAQLPPGTALAWIACDADDSPLRLFRCLVAALEPYDLPWRTEPDALLAGISRADPPTVRQRALRATTAELINALDASDVPHGVIVADDLHRVEHAAVFEFLDMLLDRFPPRWTLVIATRQEPPIALARLRARDELAEFRAADLCFERGEARALAAASGIGTELADALFDRTQGWPAGLKLALNVVAGASLPGSGARAAAARAGDALAALGPVIDRRVFDFMASEVVDRLPAPLREFLLQCSLLPELTASRCAALSGDVHAAARLEEIESAGLFADTLAGPEATLRLHELLRSALLHRLQRERPDAMPGLYARAAATEPDPARRVGYLLAAGDVRAAADDLRGHAPALLTQGALSIVARLVEQFPADAADTLPALQHVRGLLAWGRWDFEAMAAAMRAAEAGYAAAGDDDRAHLALGYRAVALGALGRADAGDTRLAALPRARFGTETRLVILLACLWNALDFGRPDEVGPLLDELVALLETSDDPALWYRGHPLPRLNGLPGTTRALDRYVAGAMRLTGETPTPLRALASTQRALRALWAGSFDDARAALESARADAQWLGEPPNVRGSLQLVDTLMATLSGRREAALAAARTMLAEHPLQRGPWSLAMHRYYAARTAAAFEDAPGLRTLLDELAALRGRFTAPIEPHLLLLRGQLAWLDADRPQAQSLWQSAVAAEAHADRLGSAVETRLRLAAAQLALRDDEAARRTLEPAADRVAGDAGLGGVLYARGVLPALADAAQRGRLGARLGAAVRGWQRQAERCCAEPPCSVGPAGAAGSPLAEGLSPREREVLARIAAGDSNKLIARAFELSPHTVKRHVANILDKLDLRSRGQAAAWYREHAG